MRIFAIGDTHFPWVDERKMDVILAEAHEFRPDYIFQMGDLYDFYSFSRYAKSLSLITPKQELLEGRTKAEAFWAGLRLACPEASLVQMLGNHDERVMKTVATNAPALEAVLEFLNFKQLWEFDGVETPQESAADEFILENAWQGWDVVFQHGHYSRLGDHARYNQLPTVVGHSHRGGVEYQRLRPGVVWELNAGFVADEAAKPLNYTNSRKIKNTVPGFGVIDEKGPRFIPLN